MAGVVSKNASGNFRIRQIHHVDSFTDTQIHSQARKRAGISGCHAFFRLKEVTASLQRHSGRFVEITPRLLVR